KSGYLNHAVMTAYEGLLPKDSYPFYVLFIDIEPERIDINVHPTKTEIKFEDEKTVYAIVHAAVRKSLGTHNIAPSLDFQSDVNFAPLQPIRMPHGGDGFEKEGTFPGFKVPSSPKKANSNGWEQLYEPLRNNQALPQEEYITSPSGMGLLDDAF